MLDSTTRELFRDGVRTHLAKRPFDVLEHLLLERPRLVGRPELLQRFWSGKEVYEEALTRCVSSIRKALDDRDDTPRYLETRWTEGYRFIGEVAEEVAPESGVERSMESAEAVTPITATIDAASPVPHHPWGWRAGLGLAVVAVVAALAWAWHRPGTVGSPTTVEQIRRLAVLPLTVQGIDPQLAEGINDELVQSVSRIEGLTLIARGSVATSVANSGDPVEVARSLGVQALLTGAVRSEEGHIVVSLRLLDASDAGVLWSYEARLDPQQVVESQGDIAARLAMHLSARLRTAPAKGPRDPATYAMRGLRCAHAGRER